MAGEKKDDVELDWQITELADDLTASGHADIAGLVLNVRCDFRAKTVTE